MKIRIFLSGMACALLTSCGVAGGNASSSSSSSSAGSSSDNVLGQVLGAVTNGDALGNVWRSVIGTDKPKQKDLLYTWTYKQPGAAFTSENALAKAGGEVAATQVKEKLAAYYQKFGITASNTMLTFNNDGTFTGKIGGKSVKGNYTYDESACKLTLQTLLFSLPCYAKRTTAGMSFLFESKKLLTIFQMVAAVSGNSTLETVGDLSKNYDGVRIGFDMSKTK